MGSSAKWLNRGVGAIAAVLLALLVPFYLSTQESEAVVDPVTPFYDLRGQSKICVELAAALPASVFSEQHAHYKASRNGFWAQQACEEKPTCVVRPRNTDEVSKAVSILKLEDDATQHTTSPLRFSIRSGGHFPSAGFASIDNGVLIDMRMLNSITVSKNQTETVIGVGARWSQVFERLDDMGLAVAGGRDANVGVGGLVLGGGISWYSPQVGMVCDNILSYEIVLANGTIAKASETQHPELWRALKGGSGNFGIVTHVTAHTFPGSKIWGGQVYWTIGQAPKVIKAMYEFAQPDNFDKYASGPIVAFGYMQTLGIKAMTSSIVYTKPEQWPKAWQPFKNIWRVWSTAKVRSLSSVSRELSELSPLGNRQYQTTTTIKLDLGTLMEIFEVWDKSTLRVRKVSNLVTSLVFQPLSFEVTHKGAPNALGLGTRNRDAPLVIVYMTAQWKHAKHDETVYKSLRQTQADVDAMAERRGTADRYRYLNYADSVQEPFQSYGEENLQFLKDVSRSFDPSGFWQRAKVGGFKLGI